MNTFNVSFKGGEMNRHDADADADADIFLLGERLTNAILIYFKHTKKFIPFMINGQVYQMDRIFSPSPVKTFQ
jgi:hypothetical protein